MVKHGPLAVLQPGRTRRKTGFCEFGTNFPASLNRSHVTACTSGQRQNCLHLRENLTSHYENNVDNLLLLVESNLCFCNSCKLLDLESTA